MSRGKPPRRSKTSGGYDVGYGKPPPSHQFKPGRSGNLRGRPKGSKNVVTDLRDVFFSPVTLTLPNGKSQRMPVWKAGLWKQAAKAAQGDQRSFQAMMQLLDKYGVLPIEVPDDAEDLTPTDAAALEDLFARMAEGKGIDLKALTAPPAAADSHSELGTNVRRVDFSLMDKAAYQALQAASRLRRSGRG
ncbi:DUF5681 domain-containing protein [Mesorhizobium sp. M1423]|uniref:DUF5681 domain-containing protein n=1 Tax=Mesorhizobium sp. M1423 TaxID=2957101 RepID=UPI00333B0239